MKTILYVGATIMIGASIYGFVDYQHTRSKKEFKDMYVEQPETKKVPVTTDKSAIQVKDETKTVAENNELTKTVSAENKTGVVKEKTTKKRRFRISEFSRAPIREEIEVVDTAGVKQQ